MKRALFFTLLLLSTGLFSCQCAEQPDVGPVEDEEKDTQMSRVQSRNLHFYG